jgi:hypothetical protein
VLSTVALGLGIRRRERLGPEILPIAVLIALGFTVHVPLAAYARFVIPLVPAAAWLVLAVLSTTIRRPRRGAVRPRPL